MRAVALAAALAATPAAAAAAPLWEAGLGAGAIAFPDYRGAERTRTYAFPVPWFVYRGEVLKADRQGLRGVFFEGDRVDLNLSLGASLPVRSDETPARAGMPDLDPALEAGPSFGVTLWRARDRAARLQARLPVRGAFTIASDPRYIGVHAFPHLNLDLRDPAGLRGWNLGLAAGGVFADARHHRHFYSVTPEQAAPGRPAYAARGGYGGTQLLAALSRRYPRFWVGAFVRYDSLDGAVFAASPLVRSKRYVAGGIAVAWILGESARRVPVDAFGERPR